MASTVIDTLDVRVISRDEEADTLKLRAAKAARVFIRRQVSATRPETKEELLKGIWELYWKLHKAGLLEAPDTTRRLLREKYGFWHSVEVAAKWAS